MKPIYALPLAFSLLACPVSAHDYWLEAQPFFGKEGEAVHLRLFVGEEFTGEAEKAFQKKATVKFHWHGAGDAIDLAVTAKEDQKPYGQATPAKAGSYLATLEREPRQITLTADKFNAYLKEEGLDAVLEDRRKNGEEKAEGRERYRRYLKALVQVGATRDDTYKKEVGHRLEIGPQAHPAERKAGDTLTVRVLFEGKPLANARLNAYRRGQDKVHGQTIRTSKEGLAEVKLDQSGPWLVRLVHMRRAGEDKEIDWESFWAGYSFAVK